MLSKIKKVAFILGLAALCAVAQAETTGWAKGHQEASGSGVEHTSKANVEPQAGSVGSAGHDAHQAAQKCKQFSNSKDPVHRRGKECDNIVNH